MAKQPIRYNNGRVPDSRIGVPGYSEERDVFGLVGRAGIGSTEFVAEYNLDVRGDLKATRIIDVDGSDGEFAYFLTRDIDGLRWVAAPPFDTNSIFIAEDGDILGVTSFTGINIISDQLLGISTNPINPNLADIRLDPRWIRDRSGESSDEETAGIYTTRKVGIGSTIPQYFLDVVGDVQIDGNLNVTGILTANSIDGDFGDFGDIVADNLFVNGLSTFVGPSTFFDGISVASTGAGTIQVGGLTTITSGIISTRVIDANFVNVFDFETVQFRSLGIATFTGIGITVNQANVGVLTVRDFLDVDAGIATFSEDTTVQVGGLTTIRSGIVSTKIVDAEFVNVKDFTTIRLDVTGIATVNELKVLGAGLTVAGITTLNGDLDANGNVDVDGQTELDDLNVSGVSTFGDTVEITSLTEDRVVIVGAGSTLEDDPNFTFDGSQLAVGVGLTVTGVSTFAGAIDANSSLNVEGTSTFQSDATFQQDATVDQNLLVSGVSTFQSDATFEVDVNVNQNLVVTGITTSVGLLSAQSGAKISNIDIGVTGDNIVDTSTGILTIRSDGNSTRVESDFLVTGISTLDNTLRVTQNSTFDENVSIGASINVSGAATVFGRLEVTNSANISQDLTVGAGLTVTEDADFQDSISVANTVTAQVLSTGPFGSGFNISTDTISGPSILFIDPVDPAGINSGTVRIRGDLFVDGTQFTVDSSIIELADFKVAIATGIATQFLLDGAGIGIGSENIQKNFVYNFAADNLQSDTGLGVTQTGSFKVGVTTVLNFSVLGTTVTESSLELLGILRELEVDGDVNITGVTTALTFNGQVNSAIGTFTNINVDRLNVNEVAGINSVFANVGIITTLGGESATFILGDFNTAQVDVGIITDVQGANLYYTTGIITDLSGTNAYYSVGDFQTLQAVSGVVTDIRSTNVFSTVVDTQELYAVTGVVTDLSGTNAYYNTVDAQNLNAVVGFVTDIRSTNAFSTVVDTQELYSVTGVVTDLSGTNAYYSVGDFQTLQAVAGVVTDLSGTNAYYSVGDLQTLQAVTGVVTDLSGTNAYYNTVDSQNLNAVVGFVTDIRSTNAFSTVVDTQELYALTGVITNFTGGLAAVDQLNSTGVVTASRFDGSADNRFTGLSSNFNAAIGVLSATQYVGGAVTQINFLSNINVTLAAGDSTTAIIDISSAPAADVAENVIGGIADITALKVTGISTFIGDIEQTSGVTTVGNLTVNGGANISGVLTAIGDGLTGVSSDFVSAIGVQSAGLLVGASFTTLNFIGTGLTVTVEVNEEFTDVADINIVRVAAADTSDLAFDVIGGRADITQLNVNGPSTMTGTVEMNGQVTLRGDLDVTGVTTTFGFIATDASIEVADFQELYAVSGVVTDLSGTNAYYTTGDLQTLQAVAGVVTDLSGTNAYYSVGDFQTLQSVAGVVTDLSGTNAYYSVVDAQTLQAVSGVVTDISGTNAYYSVGDLQTLQSVAGVVTDLSGTNVYYTTGDLQTLNAVSGVVTDLSGTNAYYTTGDLQTLQAVAGVVTDLSGTNAYYTTGDLQTLNAVTGVITNFTGGLASVDQLNSTGVVTASRFDGTADDRFTGLSSNFNAAVGLSSAGTYVGGAFTNLNFSGTNLVVTVDPEPGNITQGNINILRVAGADEAEVAISVIGGVASVTTLDVSGISTLTGQVLVENDISVAGVITATNFIGAADDRFTGLSSNFNGAVGVLSANTYISGVITQLNFTGTNLDVNVTVPADNLTQADIEILRVGDADQAGVATSVIGGIASVTALDVVGLTTLTGQVLVEGDVNVLGVVTANAFNGNINAGVGTITDLNGTNAYYSVGDFQTLQAPTGVITDLSGTNAYYSVVDAQTLQAVTGVITNFTGGLASVDQLNSTGVVTASNFVGAADDRFTGLSSQFNGAIGILSANTYISGVITQLNFTGTNLDVNVTVPADNLTQADVEILRVADADQAGVATSVIGGIASVTALDVVGLTTLTGQVLIEGDVNVLGVVTANAFNGNINAGVGTITDLNGTNAYYSVVDTQTLNAVVGVVTDISGTNAYYNVVDAQTVNAVSGVITNLTIDNTLFVDVLDAQELYAVTGVITDFTAGIVSTNNLFVTGPSTFEGSVQMPSLTVDGNGAVGGNLEVTGITTLNQLNINDLVVNGVTTTRGLAATDAYIEIGDIQTLNAVAGVVTDISGTNAYYNVVDAQTLQGVVGFITTLTVTDLFADGGVITATRFDGDRITTDTAEFTDLNVTGITTLNIVTASNINVSGSATVAGDLVVGGVLTYEDVRNVDSIGLVTARVGLNVGPSGSPVITLDNSGQANFTGIVTAPSLKVTNEAYFGLVDTQTLQAVTGVVTDLSGTNAYYTTGDLQTLNAVVGFVTDIRSTNAFSTVTDTQELYAVTGVVTDIRSTNTFSTVTDTQEFYAVTGVVTDLSGTNAYYTTGDLQTLNAVAGVVTDLSGTNAYYNVVDAQTLQGVAGVVTDLSGTNAFYSVGDLQTLNAVAAAVTDISGTNAYYSVGDFQTLQGVAGVVTDISGTNAYYTTGDLQTLNAVAGVVTDISGTNAYYNVGDLQTLQAVAGVVTDIRSTNAFSTVTDTQELYAVTGVVTNFVGTSATVFDQFNVGAGGTILTAFYNFDLPGTSGIASVGIGSTQPQALLDVDGDVRISGNLDVVGIITAENITEFKNLDDISSGFNGIATQFTIASGGTNFLNSEITSSARLLISVGGIIQEPDESQQSGFYITGGTDRISDPIQLNFAEAPRSSAAFFGVAYGLTIAPAIAYVTQEQSIINAIIFG